MMRCFTLQFFLERSGSARFDSCSLMGAQVVRVTFAREVTDERDAQSTLTMLAQVAWEKERNYNPHHEHSPRPCRQLSGTDRAVHGSADAGSTIPFPLMAFVPGSWC